MQLLTCVLLVLALVATVVAFRGGHGRPLYGVIGNAQSVEGSYPQRSFAGYGGRGIARAYEQW